MAAESIVLDQLDRTLLYALQLDGRVPFARLAQMVGVSEQTVARRYRRLRTTGVVRVSGMIDPIAVGESSWLVRIQCRPDAATALAEALARRDDVGWVTLTSGGSEIICVARSRTARQRDELLLQRLPKTAQVTGFSAQAVMHRFDPRTSWRIERAGLTDEQVETLISERIGGGARTADTWPSAQVDTPAPELGPDDELMLAELAGDGRAPIARLAELTGWTPARVNRRLEDLVRAGLLYFDAEASGEALGYRSTAFLWLTVAPASLQSVGEALAKHAEIPFVAATTGVTNLVASALCVDPPHLYRYVTERLGAVRGVLQLEISPMIRRIKLGSAMLQDGRIMIGDAENRRPAVTPGRASS